MSDETTAVSDYIDVKQKATELDCNIPSNISILPRNFAEATSKDQLLHEDTTSTIRKVLRKEGIETQPLEKEGDKFGHIAEHDLSWLGPMLYVPATVCAQNPELVLQTVTTIASFLKGFLGGMKISHKVKLSVVTETKSGKFRKVDYEGTVEGMDKIPDIVRSTYEDED